MKKRCEYVIIHNIHQSHSTHMNFCKTWDLRQYVEGGKCVSGRTTGGSGASPVGREKECPRYCCPFVIRSFPHLTDTPVFEIGTGNCLLKTTSSSGYVVLGRGLQENYKKKGGGGNYHGPHPSPWPISTTCLTWDWRHQRRTDASLTSKEIEMEIKGSSVRLVFCLEL